MFIISYFRDWTGSQCESPRISKEDSHDTLTNADGCQILGFNFYQVTGPAANYWSQHPTRAFHVVRGGGLGYHLAPRINKPYPPAFFSICTQYCRRLSPLSAVGLTQSGVSRHWDDCLISSLSESNVKSESRVPLILHGPKHISSRPNEGMELYVNR